MVLALWLTAAAVACAAPVGRSQPSRMTFDVHNPHGVVVRTIHVVHSAHFDGGCKTFGCSSRLLAGEPDLCAQHHVEPYAYHIVNRWLDDFFLRSAQYANQTRGSHVRYRHMVQPWLLSLFLSCDDHPSGAGMRSWPGSGWAATNLPVLHCPNASAVEEVKAALRRGDIFFHAFPHDAQASAFCDATLFEAALELPRRLSAQLGLPPPIAVSTRDVPGWTRATIPLLASRNITGISFGAGTPPGMPDVPPLFVWRDRPSGTDVVVTYESKYGDTSTVFVLPSGVALVANWKGDNSGPAPVDAVVNDTLALRQRFPRAQVITSTFDEFFRAANMPDVKARLPVVTQELGDGWLYGIPADPLKQSLFREACRQRAACLASGSCERDSPAMHAFERMLLKVPEHTAGVASQVFMADYANWTNDQFDVAREASLREGFYNGSAKRGDYFTAINSWVEQRTFITNTPALLEDAEPELAASLRASFEQLRHVTVPQTAGMQPVPEPVPSATFQCGALRLAVDERGAVTSLRSSSAPGSAGRRTARGEAPIFDWASEKHPLGLYQYHTFDNEDYNEFLQDFTVRVNGSEYRACPAHYIRGAPDDLGCRNFRKPNVSSAQPRHQVITPTLAKAWRAATSAESHSSDDSDHCTIVMELTMDADAHRHAGAPSKLIVNLTVTDSRRLSWSVYTVRKRATRLPEAGFFSFVPKPSSTDPSGWRLQVLGQTMDPTDVLAASSPRDRNDSVYGGSPHLRGVDSVSWMMSTNRSSVVERDSGESPSGEQKKCDLSSLDVPIICTGLPTPFPTPRTAPPDMTQGVHFVLFNNIWCASHPPHVRLQAA
jgi:hypothetical protein